ncbi:BPSL1445 family SYLF domain-containing lipoprotein [Robbsia andropogonis]|uniref:BPSL1445 family SYLF domain-containing lipoprotein n=1 Tax=Robbsia andropogonis TaxID=28092 RepID=UPI002A6A74E1|nr:YSC84-related protein [Robbsia andropogonis]
MKKMNVALKMGTAIAAATFALAGCTTTATAPNGGQSSSAMEKRHSINANVDQTLSRLYSTVPGSRELVGKARGVLVFPNVLAAGFVVGGQYGEGALRVGSETAGYYSTTSASVGLQIGAQSKAIIIVFMTQDALDKFRNVKGWSIGGDASVAVIKVGANGAIDSNSVRAPIDAFVLTNAGLMANLTLEGTKVNRMKL